VKRTSLNRKTGLRSRPKERRLSKDAVSVGVRSDVGPVIPRLVSSARTTGAAAPKTGEMHSPTLRAFVKAEAMCRLGEGTHKADELHHWPASGHAPVIDLLAFPVCRRHHGECHSGNFSAWSDERQSAEVSRFWRFLITRRPDVARAALKEMADG